MKFSLWLGITLLTGSGLIAQDAAISAFSPKGGVDGTLYAVAVQPDGGILIGGQFSLVNGVPRQNLARLKADGTLDTAFMGTDNAGLNGPVYALAVQNDGSILVGGLFSVASEKVRMNLVRYSAEGNIDPTFATTGGTNGKILALALGADGAVIAAGEFSEAGSQPRRNVAVFDAEGALKPSTVGLSGTVNKLSLTSTGSAIAVGNFAASDTSGSNIATLSK